MAKEISIIVKAIDKATSTLKNIGSNLDGRAKKNEESFKGMAIAGGVMLTGLTVGMNKALNEAGALESSMKGLKSIVNATGNDFGQAEAFIKKFTADGLVPVSNTATGLKNLLSSGLSLDKAIEMMERFKDASAYGRQGSLSMGEAIQGATEGIKNQNSVMVDNVGVTKNLSIMREDYAISIGKTVKDLTDAEKSEAAYLGVLKETTFQLGDASGYVDTYQGKLAKLTAQKTQLYQAIGNALMPVMSKLLEAITPMIERFAKWVKENPKLSSTVLVIATALAGLMVVVGGIGLAIPAIIAGFTFLATTTGLVILAIGALIAIGVALYMNWAEISAWAKSVWDGIASYFNGVLTSISNYFTNIRTGITTTLTNVWNGILGFFRTIRDGISAVFSFYITFVSGAVILAFDAMGIDIIAVFNGVRDFFVQFWIDLQALFTDTMTLMSEVWSSVRGGISSKFNEIRGILKEAVSGGFNWLQNLFKTIVQPLQTAWGAVWTAIGNTVVGAWESIKQTIRNGINWVLEKINHVIDMANKVASMGAGIGISVPKIPRIPMLAEGGIVTRPTLAMIGEGGESEAVIPLSKLEKMMGGTGGGIHINMGGVTVSNEADENRLAQTIADQIARQMQLYNYGIS